MSAQRFAKIALISAMLGLTCGLAGCSTVKLPDINLPSLKGFFEEGDEIDGYPKISEAPSAPTDIRADAVWDQDAMELIKKRDGFNDLDDYGVAKSDAKIESDLEALKAKVRAYKADDPPYLE